MMHVLVPQGTLVAGRRVALDAVEVHHLRVRRAAAGATVRLLDGAGSVADGALLIGRHDASVEVGEVRAVPAPLPLTLAIGAGERDRFAWLVEKAAETGVTEIIPLRTDRSRDVASRLRGGQVERLRRRALEAIKQCGSAWAPRISEPVELLEFAASDRPGVRWLAEIDGTQPPTEVASGPVTIVVGPEGGLTAEERWALESSGYQPVRLGEHVLRFETAALAGAIYAGIARKRGTHD
jgi:16S rRNA (uracil1498-N3)-methyltransferase